MCLLGATHNVWCRQHGHGMASAAVVGAATVGSVVFGAGEVCVTSGVLYCAVLVQQWLL